jgi:hypothetical protein
MFLTHPKFTAAILPLQIMVSGYCEVSPSSSTDAITKAVKGAHL